MSTRSNICRMNLDGSFDVIYCHYDGYPSGVGKKLFESYKTPKKVAELLGLGDLSSLQEDIGVKHPFDAPSRWLPAGGKVSFMEKENPRYTEYEQKYGRMCRAYGRDRGEKDTKVRHFRDMDELHAMLGDAWSEWVYTFRVDTGKWYYTNNPSPTWFKCCGTEQRQTSELTPEAWADETERKAVIAVAALY